MIILDTNVVSELMKSSPNMNVIMWLDQCESSELFITSITVAEISYGLHVLPSGKRRNLLENAFNQAVKEAFKHRVLEFNEASAYKYGEIMAYRKSRGRLLSVCDGQIAAIASLHGYKIATRNTSDFLECAIEVINPFDIAKSMDPL